LRLLPVVIFAVFRALALMPVVILGVFRVLGLMPVVGFSTKTALVGWKGRFLQFEVDNTLSLSNFIKSNYC